MGQHELTLEERVRNLERALSMTIAPRVPSYSPLGPTTLACVIADLLRGQECDKLQIVEKEVRRLLKVTT